jgi:hypothetical protein
MFHKIKKLPLLLILAILLAIGSSGFALYQYKELQVKTKELNNFREVGLFYDTNQKQVVVSPLIFDESNILSRYFGLNEIKEYVKNSYPCFFRSEFILGMCQGQIPSSYSYNLGISSTIFNSNLGNNSQVSAKYYGWFGSDKVEFNINTPAQNSKYNGDYYSNSEKKTYNFVGTMGSDKDYSSGSSLFKNTINLEEITNGLITGKINLFSQDNTNKLAGLSNDAVDKLNAENMYGTYTAKDQKQYDIFLTRNKETVDNWKTKEIRGKIYIGNGYGPYGNQNGIIFVKGNNENYFSNENWNFKNFVEGEEVVVKGKSRIYTAPGNNSGPIATYQPQFLPCNEGPGCQGKLKPGFPEQFSTDLGIFNIESVEKI